MRKEQISDALNLLNDTFIVETDVLRNRRRQKQKCSIMQKVIYPMGRHWKWAAAAACLILAVSAISGISLWKPTNIEQPAKTKKLPMLSITENTSDGMGFEGFWAYDISELTNNNPWDEAAQPSALPVYQNQLSYNKDFIASGADFGKIRGFLTDIAGRLGLDASSLAITDDTPDEATKKEITEKLEGDVPDGYFNPTKLTAEADGMEISVGQTMLGTVSFEPALALPEQYHFTDSASYEEAAAVAEYLKEKYKNLIHMDSPLCDIDGGHYSSLETGSGIQQEYRISFYEAGRNNVESIINYNFRRIRFDCDDTGKLSLVRLSQTDLSKKMGDYPVITAEEAKKLLSNGNYITSVPYKLPGIDYVAKAELVYRTGAREEYFMPYYRFYVELPEEERDGLKTYGIYYVPAVEKKYLSNMPLWDGSFN